MTERGRELQTEQRETMGRAAARCVEQAEGGANRRSRTALTADAGEMRRKMTGRELAQGF